MVSRESRRAFCGGIPYRALMTWPSQTAIQQVSSKMKLPLMMRVVEKPKKITAKRIKSRFSGGAIMIVFSYPVQMEYSNYTCVMSSHMCLSV